MSKYNNLMDECEYIKQTRKVGLIEALEYMLDNEELYPSEVRRELKMFMREGAMLFAPKELA
jgi:hypothetical protein